MVWFDNEWGFANRMLDLTRHWRGLWTAAPATTDFRTAHSGA